MATVEQFASELFKVSGTSQQELKTEALSVSELTLSLTGSEEFLLEFETLGQTFLFTPKGIFTFDELGDTYTLEEEFNKAIESYLNWRLKVLIRFGV